jgi:prevent-host-death family protein
MDALLIATVLQQEVREVSTGLQRGRICVYDDYMNMVKIATLKTHLSRYLAEVRDGREVVVYDRDTPIARILPYAAPRADRRSRTTAAAVDQERLADLERRAIVGHCGNPGNVARWRETYTPVVLPAGTPTLTEAHRQLRDEETW